MGFKRFNLFPAAPEYEGIAALKAQDFFAFAGQTHQRGVDFVLRQGMPATLFANIDAFSRRVDLVDDRWRN